MAFCIYLHLRWQDGIISHPSQSVQDVAASLRALIGRDLQILAAYRSPHYSLPSSSAPRDDITSLNGSIIESLTSTTFNPEYRAAAYMRRSLGIATTRPYPPSTVLAPGTNHFWPMQGQAGFLGIELACSHLRLCYAPCPCLRWKYCPPSTADHHPLGHSRRIAYSARITRHAVKFWRFTPFHSTLPTVGNTDGCLRILARPLYVQQRPTEPYTGIRYRGNAPSATLQESCDRGREQLGVSAVDMYLPRIYP